ncbi:unnamed protein product [Dovyalis caffra]|uniref:Uncharacterized protein n=1 Tax=Dovyalis caffra TaxID=77055 RepID=A0AAV1QZU9_9ROSI|nr:unnamed protein product [Dovyalis caffra]
MAGYHHRMVILARMPETNVSINGDKLPDRLGFWRAIDTESASHMACMRTARLGKFLSPIHA